MTKLYIQHFNEDKKWPNPLGYKGLAVFYPFLSDKVGSREKGLVILCLFLTDKG